MNSKELSIGLGGLVLGIIITAIFATTAVNRNNYGMMRMMGMHRFDNQKQSSNYDGRMASMHGGHMEEAMDGMMANLDGKSGDEFDKAFIDEMILHHQGAIEMANSALIKASHQEIKDLSQGIINAQTDEINKMRTWKSQWYK